MENSNHLIFADAGDDGFAFILGHPKSYQNIKKPLVDSDGPGPDGIKKGGLCRKKKEGHLVTIVGQGGTGKSILAFQILADLANASKSMSFYFSLEASPAEIHSQLLPFEWATHLGIKEDTKNMEYDSRQFESESLTVLAIPSPAEDLGGLINQIRQTIARDLNKMKKLNAVVIDPIGGVRLGRNLSRDLSRLKDLAASHRTFLFLLVESYIYNENPLIEHYSQTIIHLRHNPRDVPCRQLFVQKARGQVFASGHHQLEIVKKKGISVFPSIAAQSNDAHEHLKIQLSMAEQNSKEDAEAEAFLRTSFKGVDGVKRYYKDKEKTPVIPKIKPGSTVFLMGPPGTFKQHIATKFSVAQDLENTGCPGDSKNHCLYISFKADMEAVKRALGRDQNTLNVKPVPYDTEESVNNQPTIYFYDARSPVLTPQEVLEEIRREVYHSDRPYSRAVIWGLRRLNDMPNFSGGNSVQFLEALVTLLTSRKITSLLIDWPDIEKASTLPIVDLSQYIFLTRICRHRDALTHLKADDQKLLWPKNETDRNHVSLIRIQRTPEGFHRDRGAVLSRNVQEETKIRLFAPEEAFEHLWHVAGYRWEQDPSLIQGSEEDYKIR